MLQSVYPICECNFLTLNRNLTLNLFPCSNWIEIRSKIKSKNGKNMAAHNLNTHSQETDELVAILFTSVETAKKRKGR